ncbi:hypothetical protein PoB_002857300 [Plakobranchus ocellatus]|uniref:Uncharacterized protein n=1 Tax=Plakobranchus ocellatus TaxID=259542 RepID=A0AAV4A615_9GAST|nr:hypothetical protein PoB_002857300 [Plakobranchus ocellatus]
MLNQAIERKTLLRLRDSVLRNKNKETNKQKQNKTKQNKTKQNKTNQISEAFGETQEDNHIAGDFKKKEMLCHNHVPIKFMCMDSESIAAGDPVLFSFMCLI